MTLADDLTQARAALTMIQPEPFNAEAPREALPGDITPSRIAGGDPRFGTLTTYMTTILPGVSGYKQ